MLGLILVFVLLLALVPGALALLGIISLVVLKILLAIGLSVLLVGLLLKFLFF